MNIAWLANAGFLIEGVGLRIITDPYPPRTIGFATINEQADIVIRSSADDLGHCNAAMIPGDPMVVTATEIAPDGIDVRGLHISPIAAQESLIYKSDPADNAMYRFTLDGIHVAHFGDLGNRLTESHLPALPAPPVPSVPPHAPRPSLRRSLLVSLTMLMRHVTRVSAPPRPLIPSGLFIPGLSSPPPPRLCGSKIPRTPAPRRWRGCGKGGGGGTKSPGATRSGEV